MSWAIQIFGTVTIPVSGLTSTSATLYFRTVPILPEGSGRVAEVKVGYSEAVKQGDVLFVLDSSKQRAALETAKRKIAEVDASMATAESEVIKAEAQVQEARANYQQAKDELEVKTELQRRSPGKMSGARPIAANVDQVVVVGSVSRPDWDPHLMDRFIAVAEASDLPPVACSGEDD